MNKIQELKRWLKRSLKNKISVDDKTVITFLMLGFISFGVIAEAAWTADKLKHIHYDLGDSNNAGALSINTIADRGKAGNGTVLIANNNNINAELKNSVIIGFGEKTGNQVTKIDVENGASGIVALGIVKVLSNPSRFLTPIDDSADTKEGTKAVAIGNNVTSTTRAIGIGNNTLALAGSAIAIGSKVVASDDRAVSIGTETKASGIDSLSLGTKAESTGNSSVAIGNKAAATSDWSLAIGGNSKSFRRYINCNRRQNYCIWKVFNCIRKGI